MALGYIFNQHLATLLVSPVESFCIANTRTTLTVSAVVPLSKHFLKLFVNKDLCTRKSVKTDFEKDESQRLA